MKLYIIIVLLIHLLVLSDGQGIGDQLEDIEDKNKFNPNIITSRMYDYTTDTIAYKDKASKKCYIQRMQKNVPLPLFISKSASEAKDVAALAGTGIARFCRDLQVYKLLVPVKTKQ